LHEFDLQPGDLIYMPRGYIHEGLTSDSESLHITVGIPTFTWFDVFSEALSMCRQDVRFRKSLPVGFAEQNDAAADLEAHFRELIDVFSESVHVEDILNRLADLFITTRLPLLDGQLLELGDVDRVDVQTIVRRRPAAIYRLIADEHSVTLLFPGKRINFPKYGEPLLRFIVETSEFDAESIPGDVDIEEKLGLVRRLIREGFLITAESNDKASSPAERLGELA
jgi:hypothetical protein